jgi:hypothetical protein
MNGELCSLELKVLLLEDEQLDAKRYHAVPERIIGEVNQLLKGQYLDVLQQSSLGTAFDSLRFHFCVQFCSQSFLGQKLFDVHKDFDRGMCYF